MKQTDWKKHNVLHTLDILIQEIKWDISVYLMKYDTYIDCMQIWLEIDLTYRKVVNKSTIRIETCKNMIVIVG